MFNRIEVVCRLGDFFQANGISPFDDLNLFFLVILSELIVQCVTMFFVL
jgi:hypothetical protein